MRIFYLYNIEKDYIFKMYWFSLYRCWLSKGYMMLMFVVFVIIWILVI